MAIDRQAAAVAGFAALVLLVISLYVSSPSPAPATGAAGQAVLAYANGNVINAYYGNATDYGWERSINYTVHQYDYNTNHTYFLNETLGAVNMSIVIGGADYATPTLYRNLLLVPTMGNVTDLVDSRYDLSRGTLVEVDINTGKKVWVDTFPDQLMGQPIIAGNEVVVAMGNNQEVPGQYKNYAAGLFGINITSGVVVWHYDTPMNPDMATPGYWNGMVIEPTDAGEVNILNATTGALVWKLAVGLPDVLSSPMVIDGIAYFGAGYFGSNNGTIGRSTKRFFNFTAVGIANGTALWSRNFPYAGSGLNDECPVWYDGMVITGYLYNSSYDNPVVVALNATSGGTVWAVNETQYLDANTPRAGRPLRLGWNYTQNSMSPLVLWHGSVFADSNFVGEMFSINASTGRVNWVFDTGQNEAAPNIVGGYLVTVNDAGTMFVLNATTGALVGSQDTGLHHLGNQPVVTRNFIILGTMDGKVVSFSVNSVI